MTYPGFNTTYPSFNMVHLSLDMTDPAIERKQLASHCTYFAPYVADLATNIDPGPQDCCGNDRRRRIILKAQRRPPWAEPMA